MTKTATKKKPAAKKKKVSKVELTPEVLAAMINKDFGEGTMTFANDPRLAITRIETGILALDLATSGGLARGRHIEIYGGASVAKSAFALMVAGMIQKMGGRAYYVDAERTFDPIFAEAQGVDLETLGYHKQRHANQVVGVVETLLYSDLYDVIIVDSIASLLPKAELESDMEGGSYGTAQAKLMSQALRKLTTANDRTVVIWINQTREAINASMFAKKTITSGGKSMAFYAGTRMEFVKTETIKKDGVKTIDPGTGEIKTGKQAVAHRVLVRFEKDKTGGSTPLSETSFVFSYKTNTVDKIEDLIFTGQQLGLVMKKGTGGSAKWWVEDYEDEAQTGRTRFKKWLRKNKAVAEELEGWIKEMIQSGGLEQQETDEEEGDDDE